MELTKGRKDNRCSSNSWDACLILLIGLTPVFCEFIDAVRIIKVLSNWTQYSLISWSSLYTYTKSFFCILYTMLLIFHLIKVHKRTNWLTNSIFRVSIYIIKFTIFYSISIFTEIIIFVAILNWLILVRL